MRDKEGSSQTPDGVAIATRPSQSAAENDGVLPRILQRAQIAEGNEVVLVRAIDAHLKAWGCHNHAGLVGALAACERARRTATTDGAT